MVCSMTLYSSVYLDMEFETLDLDFRELKLWELTVRSRAISEASSFGVQLGAPDFSAGS